MLAILTNKLANRSQTHGLPRGMPQNMVGLEVKCYREGNYTYIHVGPAKLLGDSVEGSEEMMITYDTDAGNAGWLVYW
jgi:hypothetical protein